MRVQQPSMVTDGGDHALHVAEIEKVDFLQIEKTTRGTKFNPKTFIYINTYSYWNYVTL